MKKVTSKYQVSHMVIPLAGEYMGENGVVIGVNEPTGDMFERSYLIHFEDIDKKATITESLLTGDFIAFYEGTSRLVLPAWRGEIYNFMKLPQDSWSEYENDTLPPEKMNHILNQYSFYRRIRFLMTDSNMEEVRNIIVERMNLSEKEVKRIMESIERKIAYFNGTRSIDEIPGIKKGNVNFDHNENKLIEIVSYCDKYVHTNKKGETTKSKDHFPPYMSDHAIMKAIKEAYSNAEKIEKRKYDNGSRDDGTILFQGTSDDGLVIQFYFDFDHRYITTAYPVFVDTANRPDLRHPEDKSKKRPN